MRRNPFEELEDVFDRMGRQLESETLNELQTVPVDLQDEGDEYTLVADLPGYDVEDVELTYSDGNVHIDASREETAETEEEGSYVRQERTESVSRTVGIPEPIVEDEISASYNNGTLTVTLPKATEAVEGQTIDID